MLRSARHAKILEIITHKEIETQEELCEELNQLNYVVTQATISRDIRDLHLFKVVGVEKKYRYAYINDGEGEISPKMKSLFRDCVLSVKAAQNLVVVKTLTGNGANAGAVVDKLNYELKIALLNDRLLDAEDLQFEINELENELMAMGY
jgi:transcriptional regulator of arginine metabolism